MLLMCGLQRVRCWRFVPHNATLLILLFSFLLVQRQR